MNEKDLVKILQNESLIHVKPTLEMIHPSFIESPRGSVYYGTGLATPKAPSIGLPFDVLILVLNAELLRRKFSLDQIHHHIADTHALTNSFCTKESVAGMAKEYCEILERIAKVTGIKLNIHLSSEFDQTPDYREIFAMIKTIKNEYVHRELTDMLWYHDKHNVHLKLGWLIQDTETEIGFDERLFDREFRAVCDGTMSFAYSVAGRTFDPKRMRTSPYIAIDGETRVLLKPDENAREKFETGVQLWNGDRKVGGTISHLNAILRLWDRICPTPLPRGDIIDRVQSVIDLIFE